MSTKLPEIIEENNLSHAWGRAFLHVMDRSSKHLAPLIVSVTGLVNGLPMEDKTIRTELDAKLKEKSRKCSTKVSALTIFPYDAWTRRGCPDVGAFSKWYLEHFFPRLKARDTRNGHGTYFERMVRFQGSKKDAGTLGLATKNQLEHVVGIWRRDRAKGHSTRHSAIQIAIFDPAKDHTGGVMLGFPCLQQVSLAYDGEDGLAVSAYYPTQYIMDRAYGNYLGLCHLGYFLAKEMGLRMVRLNSFIGLPELGSDWTKKELKPFAEMIRGRLPKTSDTIQPT